MNSPDYDGDLRAGFLRMLANERAVFPPDRMAEIEALRDQQAGAWGALYDLIIEATGLEKSNDTIRIAISSLRKNLVEFAEVAQIIRQDSQLVLGSWLPILRLQDVALNHSFIATDPWFCLAAIVRMFGFVAANPAVPKQSLSASSAFITSDPRFLSSIVEVSRIDNEIKEISGLKAERLRLIEDLSVINKQQAIALDQSEQANRARAEVWGTFYEEAKNRLDALSSQVADAIKLEANRNLWGSRTKEHRNWMIGAFIAMALSVGILIAAILAFALPALEPTLFEVVTRSGYATQKLTLIAVCVIGAAWLLRFLARAVGENMVMRADALHRQTMLDTYLNLRGDDAMSDAERHIILTALFRPLPGQGEDNNPPTVAAEVAKAFSPR